MNTIRISKTFAFETAHALYGHDGLCRNVHGHSYKLTVTLIGKPVSDNHSPKNGMLVDFKDLKSIIQKHIISKYDHAILLNTKSKHKKIADKLEALHHRVIRCEYQPTCENMIVEIAKVLQKILPPDLTLFKLKLSETDTSFAEWYLSDNKEV